MELHGKDPLPFPPRGRGSIKGGILHVLRGADYLEALGDGCDGVAVAHPHLRLLLESLEERVGGVYGLQVGAAVFAAVGLLHLAAERMADELGAIADAQHGQTTHEARQVYLEGLGIVHAVGRTAEDDAYHVAIVLGVLVVRQNLAKRIEFAHTPADELGGLRTEVENNDFLLHV